MMAKFNLSRLHVNFRTVASERLGIGHLNRCIALAQGLSGSKHFILCEDIEQVSNILNQNGFSHEVVKLGCLGATSNKGDLQEFEDQKHRVFIFDITNEFGVTNRNFIRREAELVRSNGGIVVLIDGMDDINIVTEQDFPIDILIKPYSGADIIPNASFLQLFGSKWAIFSRHMITQRDLIVGMEKRPFPNTAEKVLITGGGSDPKNFSLLVLKAIETLSIPSLQFRIIIGPLFSKNLVNKIYDYMSRMDNLEIIFHPSSIAVHMAWCDVAIATSGLSKYELALLSKPSIQVSIDKINDLANQGFARTGCSMHLGPISEVSAELLANSIRELVMDPIRRLNMEKNCRHTVDGHGIVRISKKIEEVLNARFRH